MLSRESRKRAEAADAFAAAGRGELAERERREGEVLARYLPRELSDDELNTLAQEAVEEVQCRFYGLSSR